MDSHEMARLRATISALVAKSQRLRLELEDRLANLDKVRLAMRRMQRSLRRPHTN